MRDFYLRWWHGNEAVLGIDLRDDAVLIAQSQTVPIGGESLKTFTIPLPMGVIEKGCITDAQRLVSILRASVRQLQLSGCRCAVALPSTASLIAYLEIPSDVRRKPESELYEWALMRLSLEGSKVCGKVFLETPDSRGLLFVGARRSVSAMLEGIFRTVGLELSCITLRSIAVHKGAGGVSEGVKTYTTTWIDLTDRSPALHLFEGEVLRHSKYFNVRASEEMALLVSTVREEIQKMKLSQHANATTTALCAGPERAVREFEKAWKDSASGAHVPLSLIEELKTEAPYWESHLVAIGLVQLLREFP